MLTKDKYMTGTVPFGPPLDQYLLHGHETSQTIAIQEFGSGIAYFASSRHN